MSIEKGAIVRDHYEVIVVGAGLGGLTTAAMLAKKGVDVLLIEQHRMPGGCCSSIRRQGVTMDVGTTIFYGFGETGLNTHRFVMNELEEPIDMISRQSVYHLHIGDKEMTFWREFAPTFDELVELFPNQKQELKAFYDYLYKLYRVVESNEMITPPTEAPAWEGIKSLLKNPVGLVKMMSLMSKSGTDLFERFFSDRELIAYFDMLTRILSYVDAKESPAMFSATMFTDHHEGGAYYPAGSPQMLPNKLEQSIDKFGGQILYCEAVDEILIQADSAVGVRLKSGKTIAAQQVVYNGTVWNLYGKMVKPLHINPEKLQWAQALKPVHSNLMLYLCVDAEGIPKNSHPMEIYVDDPESVEGHGVTVYIPSHIDKTLAPEGMFSVTISSVASKNWPAPSDPAYKTEQYNQRKQQEAEKVLELVGKRMPKLRQHIRCMEVATPSTMEKFTLKNWGNIGGPKQALGQEMMKRPQARTDWKNLFFCGDSTVMGLGALPATVSGVGAANRVLQARKISRYKARKFSKQYVQIIPSTVIEPPFDASAPVSDANARRVAKECQWCSVPACTKGCPAGIDLVGFHRRVEMGNFSGAARSMREMNPLSALCGIVCPSERFCEKNCYRKEYAGAPVSIAALHGHICTEYSDPKSWFLTTPSLNGKSIAVVGAGPAGLSCAYYLARSGYRVDVFDKNQQAGGKPFDTIPNFRLTEELVRQEVEGISRAGVHFHFGQVLGENLSLSDLERDYAAVFVGLGLGKGRRLELPGSEQLDASVQVVDALSLLQDFNAARLSESLLEKLRGRVLIVGGGSVAADTALAAKNLGAHKIDVVCLESKAQMPMLVKEVDELEKHGIVISNGWGPQAFELNANGEPVVKWSACLSTHQNGTFNPVFDTSKQNAMGFDVLVWAVGQALESKLSGYLKAELGAEVLASNVLAVEAETGRVRAAGRNRLFAGGDIIRGAGTVVEAVADGRKTAAAIDRLLTPSRQAVSY
jgi:phytoene dehydrogenase-like protein